MSDTLERLQEREPVRPHPNSVTRFEPFYELSESEFRALLDIAEAAQAKNPCPFCGGTSATQDRFTHEARCPLVPFLDATWPAPIALASLDAAGGADNG